MIGLGVGIDYALFLVTRYRLERKEGKEIDDAIATAVSTSGTAVVFAGGTVVIALVSLLVAGIPLVTSLGYASAFAVVTAVVAAITLLPAVLSAVGRHIDSFRLPAFMRPKPKPVDRGFWGAWAHVGDDASVVGRRHHLPDPGDPVIPFFSLYLGQEDIGATPKSTTERQAYDYLSQGFGPGYTSPLLVAVKLPSPAEPSSTFNKQYKRAQRLQSELEDEQATGQAQAASLQAQGDDLEAEQVRLEGEKASLQSQANSLKARKATLKQSATKLKQQSTLIAEAQGLTDQARDAGGGGAEPVRPGEPDRGGATAEPDAGAGAAAQGGQPAAQGAEGAGERAQGRVRSSSRTRPRRWAARPSRSPRRRRCGCEGGHHSGAGEEPADPRGGERPGSGGSAPDAEGAARDAPATGRHPAAAGGKAEVDADRRSDGGGRGQARDRSAAGQSPERPEGDDRGAGGLTSCAQQVGTGGDLQRGLDDRSGRQGDRQPRQDDSGLRHSAVDAGDRTRGPRRGIDRLIRRSGLGDLAASSDW